MNYLNEIALEYQSNKVRAEDSAVHSWYRFVLSYPPHLVKYYLTQLGSSSGGLVLDPFSGTGTTLVESKLNHFDSVGIEANPVVRFATKTKLNWDVNPELVYETALAVSEKVDRRLKEVGIEDKFLISNPSAFLKVLPVESSDILLKNSISPLPLHKALILFEEINNVNDRSSRDHLLLAGLKTVISDMSNLRFGPEVGVGKIKSDAQLISPWLKNVWQMKLDLETLGSIDSYPSATVHLGDAREPNSHLKRNSVGCVITSPPYPNEKDYSRTTRLESVLMGLVTNSAELRSLKKSFVRSNTRSIYKEDKDHLYVSELKSIQKIAADIEERRIELGKTSGFEKMYPKVTLQYFGGMARHLSNLRESLIPGAKLAYVVGDQASYLRVMIRTGQLLAEIAETLDYKVHDLELFRTRFATASKEELREEVLILEYKG